MATREPQQRSAFTRHCDHKGFEHKAVMALALTLWTDVAATP